MTALRKTIDYVILSKDVVRAEESRTYDNEVSGMHVNKCFRSLCLAQDDKKKTGQDKARLMFFC